MEKFRIFQQDNKQMIEHLEYPRFIAEITFGEKSDVEHFTFFDDPGLDAQKLARLMSETGDYIYKHSIK